MMPILFFYNLVMVFLIFVMWQPVINAYPAAAWVIYPLLIVGLSGATGWLYRELG